MPLFDFEMVKKEVFGGETTYAVKMGPEETKNISDWSDYSGKSFGDVLVHCIIRGYDAIRDEPEEYGYACRPEHTTQDWQLGQA